MKIFGAVILALVAILGITWIAQGNDFFMYQFFAPKYEQVRRDTFEHTRSFNQGMIQELENMQADYVKTKDPEAKKALASIILHRASGYNLNDPDVPQELRTFIAKLREERNGNDY